MKTNIEKYEETRTALIAMLDAQIEHVKQSRRKLVELAKPSALLIRSSDQDVQEELASDPRVKIAFYALDNEINKHYTDEADLVEFIDNLKDK